MLLVANVRDALKEQQREDVGLEVRRIHWPAQDVGRFPEMRFELVKGDAAGHVYIKFSCGGRSLFGIPSQGHAFLR